MTPMDHVALLIGAGSICLIAGVGVFAAASIVNDLHGHHHRLAEVWADLVEAAAARWHAIATLFPVTSRAVHEDAAQAKADARS